MTGPKLLMEMMQNEEIDNDVNEAPTNGLVTGEKMVVIQLPVMNQIGLLPKNSRGEGNEIKN